MFYSSFLIPFWRKLSSPPPFIPPANHVISPKPFTFPSQEINNNDWCPAGTILTKTGYKPSLESIERSAGLAIFLSKTLDNRFTYLGLNSTSFNISKLPWTNAKSQPFHSRIKYVNGQIAISLTLVFSQ